MKGIPGRGIYDRALVAADAMVNGNSHARFAVTNLALSVATTPIDVALRGRERRITAGALSSGPILIVCGAPRSGTTIAAQLLSRHLPVTYPTNLMDMFPRSPIAASRLFGVEPDQARVGTASYYGRSRGYSGRSDALNLWDRFISGDRTDPDRSVADDAGLRRWFASMGEEWGRPTVAKNNGANTFAHEIAKALENAQFLCVERDPLFHAQSLLVARRTIHRSDDVPYGVDHVNHRDDVIEDVVEQTVFHARRNAGQHDHLGDRFRLVDYGDLCSNPTNVIEWASDVLGVTPVGSPIEPLTVSNGQSIADDEFRRLEAAIEQRMGRA